MRFKEPTKGKSFRSLFRRNKYDVFLVDEYNTSKTCHFNGNETEKFRKRVNPRSWKNDIRLIHSLLRSKSVPDNKSEKSILIERDINASLNIRTKAVCILKNINIPEKLKNLIRPIKETVKKIKKNKSIKKILVKGKKLT